jgi:TPR repeat protein
MKSYVFELAPWERLDEYRDNKEIKNQITKQTAIAKKQLAVLSKDYPLAVAEQYPYGSYLDANRYGINNDDAIYAVEGAVFDATDAMNRNAEVMDAGFNRVSGEINEQTSAMKIGMAGIVGTQVASTALIMKTLNENAEFLAETIDSGFDLMHDDMQDIVSGVNSGFDLMHDDMQDIVSGVNSGFDLMHDDMQDIVFGVNDLKEDFNIAMGNVLAQIELLQDGMQSGFKHISSILKRRRKIDAQEHFEDALGFYKDGNRFSSKPQWFKDAKKHFLASIELYTRNPLAHLYLGHIYHYQKEHRDFKKAFEHYRLSAVYGMSDEKTHCIAAKGSFFAAWLQASVFKNIKEAISYSKEAIQFDPKFSKAYYNLAKYYAKDGDASNAIKFLEIAITKHDRKYAVKVLLDPDFEPIKESVKRLLDRLKKGAILQFEKAVEEIHVLLYEQKDEWEKDEWYVRQSDELKEVVKVARRRDAYYDYLDATDFLRFRKILIKEKISIDIERWAEEERIRKEKEKADKERQAEEERIRKNKEKADKERQAEEERIRKEKEKADKERLLKERQLRQIRKKADRARKFKEKQLRQEQIKQEQIRKEKELVWQCWYVMFTREVKCFKAEKKVQREIRLQKARQDFEEWQREEQRKKKEKKAKFRLRLLVFFVLGLVFILAMIFLI